MALIYIGLITVPLMGFVSLSVDWGRVQLAKLELSRLADASARAAAADMQSSFVTARTSAKTLATSNNVDGATLTLVDTDIQFGVWTPSTRTFTIAENASANAVRVTAARTVARGNAVQLLFAPMIGMPQMDVSAQSIVARPGNNQTVGTSVSGFNNVWFAGLASSATATYSGDITNATTSGALGVTALAVTPGAKLRFVVSGSLSHSIWPSGDAPDGGGWIHNNWTNNLGGKSNLTAPINSLLGVFLTSNDPTTEGAAPPNLDFSSGTARDFASLSPVNRQVFFIGDGMRTGAVVQEFIVPANATRLFLGSQDPFGWHNNSGSVSVSITSVGGPIVLLK